MRPMKSSQKRPIAIDILPYSACAELSVMAKSSPLSLLQLG